MPLEIKVRSCCRSRSRPMIRDGLLACVKSCRAAAYTLCGRSLLTERCDRGVRSLLLSRTRWRGVPGKGCASASLKRALVGVVKRGATFSFRLSPIDGEEANSCAWPSLRSTSSRTVRFDVPVRAFTERLAGPDTGSGAAASSHIWGAELRVCRRLDGDDGAFSATNQFLLSGCGS